MATSSWRRTGQCTSSPAQHLTARLPLASQVFFDCVTALGMVLGAFLLLMIVVPFIIPVFLPLGIAFFWVGRGYGCARLLCMGSGRAT